MADDPARPADQQRVYLQRFEARLRSHLRTLIDDELIEEHRRKPLGQHSDALERVLNYFRRPAKFGLYSPTPCREFQVIGFPVAMGEPPTPLDDVIYTDKNEALHAVFLKQVDALRAQ